MAKKKADEPKITIDGNDYLISSLSENAKSQVTNIQFVDTQLQQLNNEWAVSDTARIGYTNALKNEFEKVKPQEK
tara:strand:+ start:87 stop:311 length:225 start_codon:yes stop_codon:yes gene_type:complete